MMKALLALRFRALLAGFLAQTRKKKSRSKGMLILFAVLYLYVAVVICGAVCLMFSQLAAPYHQLGLDWLYFSMAGLMGLGFAVVGSVFTTQSQLYDARDNDLLLSMPVRPRQILLSRMLPLLMLNLLFAGLVMIPAAVMYAILVRFCIGWILLQLCNLLAVCLLAQAISCALGWLLHQLLSRMHKSAASMLYMVIFLGVYFAVYSQAGNILNTMAVSGSAIAGTFKSWIWPLYAMGRSCVGSLVHFPVFALLSGGFFVLVYAFLSATFLRAATTRRSGKRRNLDVRNLRTGTINSALVYKQWRQFLNSPVYLTNMGIGAVFTVALTVAGLIFRDTLTDQLYMLQPQFSLLICLILCSLASLGCISTPSVSLEGKSLWILKSLPLTPKQILLSKLRFHNAVLLPLTAVSGLVLSIAYGCSGTEILLCAIVPGFLVLFCGLLGLICGLQWARFDWISEAYPVKQSLSVLIAMFASMGVPMLGAVIYILLEQALSPALFLALSALVLALLCAALYRVLTTWGVKKWNSL